MASTLAFRLIPICLLPFALAKSPSEPRRLSKTFIPEFPEMVKIRTPGGRYLAFAATFLLMSNWGSPTSNYGRIYGKHLLRLPSLSSTVGIQSSDTLPLAAWLNLGNAPVNLSLPVSRTNPNFSRRLPEQFEYHRQRPAGVHHLLVARFSSMRQLPAWSESAATMLCAYHRDK
jgi:hypothetical protein